MAPGATPAIENNERFAGQWFYPPAQRFDALRIRTGPDVLRAGNVRLHVQKMRANVEDQRLFAFGRLQNFDQVLGIDQLGAARR